MDEDSSYVSLSIERYNKLYEKARKGVTGWRPIKEYLEHRNHYDWVLIKYFDNGYECVPCVAELRNDGKWYDRSGNELPFQVVFFFDMQELDQ